MNDALLLAPRLDEWNSTMDCSPEDSRMVLGFYADKMGVKSVWCEMSCVGNKVVSETWFDCCGEVDAPDCWAHLVYPGEDE